MRDHIRFPKAKRAVQEIDSVLEEESKPLTQERRSSNKSVVDQDGSFCKRTAPRVSKMTETLSSRKVGIKKKSEKTFSGSNISRKRKANDAPGQRLKKSKMAISKENRKNDGEERQPSLGDKLYALMTKGSEKNELGKHDDSISNNNLPIKPAKMEMSGSLPKLDADSERRWFCFFQL